MYAQNNKRKQRKIDKIHNRNLDALKTNLAQIVLVIAFMFLMGLLIHVLNKI